MANLAAVVRSVTAKLGVGTVITPQTTELQSLLTTRLEPDRLELARQGRYWYGGNMVIANGVAPVTAIPTTAGTFLFNGNTTDSLVLDKIFGPWLGSGTAAAGATLLMGISTSIQAGTLPTAHLTGWGSKPAVGGTTRTSKAWWDATSTFTASTMQWVGVKSTQQLAAATPGQGDGVSVEMHGSVIVPPGYAVGFAVFSAAGTTPLYGWSCSWAELPITVA